MPDDADTKFVEDLGTDPRNIDKILACVEDDTLRSRLRTAYDASVPYIMVEDNAATSDWHLVSVPSVRASNEQMQVIRRASEVNRLLSRVERRGALGGDSIVANTRRAVRQLTPGVSGGPSEDEIADQHDAHDFRNQLKWLCQDAILSRGLEVKMVDLKNQVKEIEREISVQVLDPFAKRKFSEAAFKSVVVAMTLIGLYLTISLFLSSYLQTSAPLIAARAAAGPDEAVRTFFANFSTIMHTYASSISSTQLIISIGLVSGGALLGRMVAFLWFYRQMRTSINRDFLRGFQ